MPALPFTFHTSSDHPHRIPSVDSGLEVAASTVRHMPTHRPDLSQRLSTRALPQPSSEMGAWNSPESYWTILRPEFAIREVESNSSIAQKPEYAIAMVPLTPNLARGPTVVGTGFLKRTIFDQQFYGGRVSTHCSEV